MGESIQEDADSSLGCACRGVTARNGTTVILKELTATIPLFNFETEVRTWLPRGPGNATSRLILTHGFEEGLRADDRVVFGKGVKDVHG